MLACADCNAPHDLDLGPDDGTCIICGGELIEDESERGEVRGRGAARQFTVRELEGIIANGRVDRGEN